MEEFLRSYVRMMAETMEIKLTRKQLQTIVHNLECEDEIWETLDSYIQDELEDVE